MKLTSITFYEPIHSPIGLLRQTIEGPTYRMELKGDIGCVEVERTNAVGIALVPLHLVRCMGRDSLVVKEEQSQPPVQRSEQAGASKGSVSRAKTSRSLKG